MARSPLVTTKVFSPDVGAFSETVDFTVLHCANVTGNNNKFYCIEIQQDPNSGRHRLFSNYGRLETSEVFEIRDTNKLGEDLDYDRCKLEYDKLIKTKQRGKMIKPKNGEAPFREKYSIVEVVSPTVGSSNIRNATDVKMSSAAAPMVNTKGHDKQSSRIINLMVSENVHNITSNTTIQFTNRGFETSLGPVTESHLDKADDALGELRDLLNGHSRMNPGEVDVRDGNSSYFSLIPRRFGYQIKESDMILTGDDLAKEFDLLDNLRTAVRAGLNSNDSNDNDRVAIKISVVSKSDNDFRRLNDKYEASKYHGHACGAYRVKNVFTLDIPNVTKRFAPVSRDLGNLQELFHGTRTANMLSISLNGLIIPPTGAAHVTGRMFGNGVYAATCSTKALNYAVGYWGGANRNQRQAFMYIVQFAMGKDYVASSHRYSGAPSGYDSVWAKAGRGGLANDELIVYKLNQVTITHVIELEK